LQQFIPHRREEALAIIANLNSRYPDHPGVNVMQAEWLLWEGRMSEAVPLPEKVLVLDPGALWARFDLNIAWFSLGETKRTLDAPHRQRQWRYVLSPDREGISARMKEIDAKHPPGTTNPFHPNISADVYIMLGQWQSAVDALSARAADPAAFLERCLECARNYSPAVSLAVAYRALGDLENFEKFVELEKEALNIRSDFHTLQNSDFSRASARIDALENSPYEALLHLERLITSGPMDPRDLSHPAFDEIRKLPGFKDLENLHRHRVDSEREKLGLAPIAGEDSAQRARKAQ
jgi:tetratricopeptide (TPR) repeat protein